MAVGAALAAAEGHRPLASERLPHGHRLLAEVAARARPEAEPRGDPGDASLPSAIIAVIRSTSSVAQPQSTSAAAASVAYRGPRTRRAASRPLRPRRTPASAVGRPTDELSGVAQLDRAQAVPALAPLRLDDGDTGGGALRVYSPRKRLTSGSACSSTHRPRRLR